MKKSALLIGLGVILFLSLIPLVLFYGGGLFLTCLFGLILFVSGISMIIYGIIVLVKGMNSKKDQLEFETDEIKIAAFLEPFYWIKDATVRIFRNRRRSSAMLSGIILSSLVIASVFIYTGVMQQDFYNDIVKSVPFEASFTLNDQGNESTLWDIGKDIENDDRVESYTVFGGANLLGDGGYDWRTESYSNLEVTFPVENISEPKDDVRYFESIAVPVFVRPSFAETTIYEKMFGDNLEGSFDLDINSNSTVMPRTRANKMDLDVGDIIPILNISIYSFSYSFDWPSEFEKTEDLDSGFKTIQLRNVEIVGIFSDDGGDENEGGDDSFFFNTGIIEKFNPEFMREMERFNLFTLAVKIDASEFSVNNMNTMSNQITRFVSDVSRESDDRVSGQNNIEGIIGFLFFIRIFIIVLDFIMILPTVILSLYFLVFGLDLSLEERKREIAILKVQGGNSKQIYRMVAMESVILFAVGLTLGYFLSIVAAWIISSSIGFMNFDLSFSYLKEFWGYHQGALITSSIVVGFIVLISIVVKARKFIKLEVAEGVQQMEKKKKGFFRRTHLDLVLFGFGVIAALKKILDVVFGLTSVGNFSLSLGEEWDAFLFGFLGTLALWIGGALSGPTIAQWISLRSEKLFLKLFFLKDVALIIKSGLKRRGDAAKLVLIIILTLSVATLAAVQGFTDQINSERDLEYQIGADYKVIMSEKGDHVQSLENISGIRYAMPIIPENVEIFSTSVTLYGIDSENAMFMAWHEDSFNDISPKSALKEMDKKSEQNGVFLGSDIAGDLGAGKGDRLDLKVQKDFPLPFDERYELLNVLVLGTFDHAPPEIGQYSILCDHSTTLRIKALKSGEFGPQPDLNSTTYLLDKDDRADPKEIKKELDRTAYIINVRDLDREINDISKQLNFGIPGLLTMMFIVSIICVFTSAFAFSSIIIKRRMREFAVLQTVGATRWQIYKIAIGENALVMFVSVVLGLLVGLGLSYQMNGFFGALGEMLGRGSLERVVFLPWFLILMISGAIFIGMLLAVAVSAVNAARQDLAVSTRVV